MESSPETPSLAARPQEALLIDLVPMLPAGHLLTNTVGRGQFAAAYASAHPSGAATCWSLDLFQHQLIAAQSAAAPANLRLSCSSDLPEETFDLAALLVHKQGDGELVRDILQQAAIRLKDGGLLLAASDNPTDIWLGEQLERLFTKIVRRPHPTGTVYQAIKAAPPKKIKQYDAEVVFRDGAHLLQLKTRPGVFSHREIDPGARALLRNMYIEPDAYVLDIGCGSGAVALAAAARGAARVHAIDSNARAVQCTAWAAETNKLLHITTALDCDGSTVEQGVFDLAVTNPPYFANYRIAELFSRIAAAALRPNGQLMIVTKTPQWYVDRLPEFGLGEVEVDQAKNYMIVRAWRQATDEE